jgi:hypothetical protein
MGLHLRGRGLQLSPYEESGVASAVSQSQAVLEKALQAAADATKTLPLTRKSRNLDSILSRAVVFPQPARAMGVLILGDASVKLGTKNGELKVQEVCHLKNETVRSRRAFCSREHHIL